MAAPPEVKCQAANFPWYSPEVSVLVGFNETPSESAANGTASSTPLPAEVMMAVSVVIFCICMLTIAACLLVVHHLRKNILAFSKKTYRMHVQLITVILIQV
jgi:hypothetical protein